MTQENAMADDTGNDIDLATGLTRNDLRNAALTVCRYSADAEDARYLLEALGLIEDLRAESVAS